MKSKNLSKLMLWVFLWCVMLVAFAQLPRSLNFVNLIVSSSWFEFLIVASFFYLFFLFMSRMVSYLALSAFKGQRIDFVEFMYRLYWIFLTEEARGEWRRFICHEKIRDKSEFDKGGF
jgi:hypothetical protein